MPEPIGILILSHNTGAYHGHVLVQYTERSAETGSRIDQNSTRPSATLILGLDHEH